MSEVAPGVFVTSALVARQGKVLDEFGITHVVSIQAKPISPFAVNQTKRESFVF